jgi:hypothetical protein
MKRNMLILIVLLIPSFTAPASSYAVSPTNNMAAMEKEWHDNLRSSALNDPSKYFANLSRKTFNARLHLAAQRYHFIVVRVEMFHPRQFAPLVVVKAKNESALSASTPAIMRLIDPMAPVKNDRTRSAYEGFLFQAQNSHGVPFLVIVNWYRDSLHAGGGQWAADPNLLPFPHG